uniref:Retrotransposon gag domain-containing protein n=1 Tax=Trichogramma kaykai TaxID=54128 RepID=A0ABD2W2I0_9HYME
MEVLYLVDKIHETSEYLREQSINCSHNYSKGRARERKNRKTSLSQRLRPVSPTSKRGSENVVKHNVQSNVQVPPPQRQQPPPIRVRADQATGQENSPIQGTGEHSITGAQAQQQFVLQAPQPRPYGLQPAKLTIPTFLAAEYEKPMQFLSDFMDYYHAVGLTEWHFYHVIKQALRGSAGDWWYHISDNVTSIADFERRFKERFWSRMIQARKREQLETGFYNADKNQSRSEYVIAIYNQIKALDSPPAEIDMIDKFSRHFDFETQNAIIAQRIHRVNELIEFLDHLDNAGKLNMEKAPERTSFVRREPYWTRLPENHGPNRIMSRPTYPRREDYQRDYRRDNGRNNPPK